jgi:hypothetical protein
MVNHCSSNVFVRLLRHGSKVTARNAGMCHALGCPPVPREVRVLPATWSPLATQREAKGVMVFRLLIRMGREGRRKGEIQMSRKQRRGMVVLVPLFNRIVSSCHKDKFCCLIICELGRRQGCVYFQIAQ